MIEESRNDGNLLTLNILFVNDIF